MQERRRHPRVKPDPLFHVQCYTADFAENPLHRTNLAVRCLDLSARGACIVTPGRLRIGAPLVLAIAGPVIGATLLVGALAVAETLGATPLSYPAPRNIAEAAGMGLGAEVLRFLRLGADPNAVFDVAPEIVSASLTRLTAGEAAVFSRRVELVRMLDRQGAFADPGVRRHLTCLAAEITAPDIHEHLAAASAAAGDCAPEQSSRVLLARRR